YGRGTSGGNVFGTPRGAMSRGGMARGNQIGGPGGGRGPPKPASQGSQLVTNCNFCGKPGHTADTCWKKARKCFRCGSTEHQIAECPQKKEDGGASGSGERPKVPARVYALDQQQEPDPSDVVEGTLLVFHRLARVLIDPGATHSFINPTFMSGIDFPCHRLPFDLEFGTPTGTTRLISSSVYKDCEVWIGERKLLVDLIQLDIKGYDVILGMDS
ncbi:MAG: hypothetical protein CBHOC_5427, partial [uncultured Caballeronia sp.]